MYVLVIFVFNEFIESPSDQRAAVQIDTEYLVLLHSLTALLTGAAGGDAARQAGD